MRRLRRRIVQRDRGLGHFGLRSHVATGRLGPRVKGLQLQRRSGGPARGGPAAGRRRDARLERLRTVGDGDEPSGPGVHGDRRGGRGRSAEPAGDSGPLSGALPAGRRVAAVRDDADEPAARQGRQRLRAHRRVGQEGDQGGAGLRRGQRRRERRGPLFHLRARPGDLAARRRRGVPALHRQRDDRRGRVLLRARDRRRAAGQRHVVQPLVPAGRRVPLRPDLRRRAEEHRPGRADHRDHPRRPGRARPADTVADARLRDPRQGGVDVQHAADVRDLPRRTGVPPAAGRRAAWRRPSSATSPRPSCCTTTWTAATSTPTRWRRPTGRG